MKSWADHCSSDEESDDGRRKKTVPEKVIDDKNKVREEEEVVVQDPTKEYELPPPPPLEEFPTLYPEFYQALQDIQGPPYSAHMGNFPYDINTYEALSRTIEELVEYRYKGEKQVRVASGRVGFDRETRKPKGFANVSFDTLDEVGIIF